MWLNDTLEKADDGPSVGALSLLLTLMVAASRTNGTNSFSSLNHGSVLIIITEVLPGYTKKKSSSQA